VQTHLEIQKSQSKDERAAFQEDLLENHAVRKKIVLVDIESLHPPMTEAGQPLYPYQERSIQKYFLQEFTKRMEL
jgi:hypothetical protein